MWGVPPMQLDPTLPIRIDQAGVTRWTQESARGVIDHLTEGRRNPNVQVEHLLPRVVFRGDVTLDSYMDHLVLGPIGSRSDYLTVTFKPALQLTTGCFTGTLEQFEALVETSGGRRQQEYEAVIALLRVLAETRAT